MRSLVSLSHRRARPALQRFRQLSTNAVGGSSKSSPIGWPSLLLALGLGSFGLGYYLREKDKAREKVVKGSSKTIGKALLGGPFVLVDHNGQVQSEKTMFPPGNDRFALFYFGFTNCPDICPSEMVKISSVIRKVDGLGAEFENKLFPVFITVDPRRDGVEHLKHYIKDFHPRTVGLTGTPQQVAEVCKSYRVYHVPQKVEDDTEDYLVDHSIVIYLLSPQGVFLDFFTQLTEPEEITERIKQRMLNWTPEDDLPPGAPEEAAGAADVPAADAPPAAGAPSAATGATVEK